VRTRRRPHVDGETAAGTRPFRHRLQDSSENADQREHNEDHDLRLWHEHEPPSWDGRRMSAGPYATGRWQVLRTVSLADGVARPTLIRARGGSMRVGAVPIPSTPSKASPPTSPRPATAPTSAGAGLIDASIARAPRAPRRLERPSVHRHGGPPHAPCHGRYRGWLGAVPATAGGMCPKAPRPPACRRMRRPAPSPSPPRTPRPSARRPTGGPRAARAARPPPTHRGRPRRAPSR
jgi:hypothetical protein